jgi:hypothetical protein
MTSKTRYPVFIGMAMLLAMTLAGFQTRVLADHDDDRCCPRPVVSCPTCPAPAPIITVSCPAPRPVISCPAPCPVACPAPCPVVCPTPCPVACPAPVVYRRIVRTFTITCCQPTCAEAPQVEEAPAPAPVIEETPAPAPVAPPPAPEPLPPAPMPRPSKMKL